MNDLTQKFNLHCRNCDATYKPQESLYRCPSCDSRLWVEYPKKIRFDLDALAKHGMWKHFSHLPLLSEKYITSIGEGDTPLVELKQENSRVFVKSENINPTGTYKDRPASLAVSRALELGGKGVTVASDGNTAPAVAAYAAMAGLDCVVFMPKETPVLRYSQAAAFGAKIILIDGDVNDCLELANQLTETAGYHHCSTAGYVNPYQFEANKTIAFEIVENLLDAPDWVSLPLGGGGLLIGLYLGFKELYEAGITTKIPQFLPVQSASCAPFVLATESSKPVERWKGKIDTIAFPIAVPYPPDGDAALACLQDAGGKALAVNDEKLLQAVRHLAKTYGVLSEPAGGVSFAGYLQARADKVVGDDETTVCVISGTGLKSIETFIGNHTEIFSILGTIDEVQKLLKA
ncbi:MAG: threonine synthase [Spirochaetia bacterium]|nr:threonine synthase [Spirochaetia bacterium]